MLTRGLRLLLVLVVTVTACVEVVTPAPSPATSPGRPPPSLGEPALAADMTAVLRDKPMPAADAFMLTRTIRGRGGEPAAAFQPVRAAAPAEQVGSASEFWVYNFDLKKNEKAHATLRLLTPSVKWWVADGVTPDLAALRVTADVFERTIYPASRRLYGSEWSPGIDADPRINVLLANIPGAAAGYFSISDERPRWVNEFSSEREIVYINALSARLGTTTLHSVLAHEFCHMIQANKRAPSVVWIMEGHAQMCEAANGLGTGFEQAYLRRPDTQLNDWPDLDGGAAAAYGGSYLFLEFLRQKAGGEDLLNAMLSEGIQTTEDLDRVLRARGKPGVQELFADFVAANALVGQRPEDRYAYAGPTTPRTTALVSEQDRIGAGATLRGTVHNYAARYIELPRVPVQVRFSGASASRILPTDAHSGRSLWWSDRADSYEATLTRTVDLRAAATASLTFWAWYEIEKEYDYAYVTVSTNGGASWRTLPGTTTTTADPLGHNLGNGYTDRSGGAARPPAAWVQERVDLSAFAGQEILLAFRYVTDEGRATEGFAIDDIELSTGFKDDAETGDNGWIPKGFVRSTNVVRQDWVVQVIRFGTDRPTVERHVVAGGGLTVTVDATGDRRAPLLALTPFASRTVEPVPFEIVLQARP